MDFWNCWSYQSFYFSGYLPVVVWDEYEPRVYSVIGFEMQRSSLQELSMEAAPLVALVLKVCCTRLARVMFTVLFIASLRWECYFQSCLITNNALFWWIFTSSSMNLLFWEERQKWCTKDTSRFTFSKGPEPWRCQLALRCCLSFISS